MMVGRPNIYGGATLQLKLDCGGHFVVARADLQRHFLLFAGHARCDESSTITDWEVSPDRLNVFTYFMCY